ncbi:MAG: hypothetical protein INF50_00240, partial [Rhodobacter sp.]|nr:hypothetical protein [Rhodobacter sp.]
AIPFLGRVSALFGFVPLSAGVLAAVVAIVGGYMLATEIAKLWFFGAGASEAAGPGVNPGGRK